MADAAQEFLDSKLSKNRFTAKQQQALDKSGGAAVVNASEGVVPAGEAYAKYGKMPSALTDKAGDTATDTSTTSSAGSGDKYRGFGQDSDSGRNYASGAWGSGDLDAAALAAKYKLDTSQEGRGDGHIWGRNSDGSEVYIGKSSMDLASNKDLISNHSKQANSDEVDHSSAPENLSSSGDIKGAILTEWAGSKKAPAPEPEKEPERAPIEHSPEIKQAKERVRSYEDNVLSGKTSNDIYGQQNANKNIVNPVNEKFDLDLNKGVDGIGSAYSGNEPTNVATDSFLDSKKTDLKKQYNFQPAGAN